MKVIAWHRKNIFLKLQLTEQVIYGKLEITAESQSRSPCR